MSNQNNLQAEIQERLRLIRLFTETFKEDFSEMPDRFLRGRIQKYILKKHNLPVSGRNMRTVNEAIEKQGYKKIYIDGWSYFKKIRDKNG